MSVRFARRPIEPVRWVRARRGNATNVQHVVAKTPKDSLRWMADKATFTLCGANGGAIWCGVQYGSTTLGPQTQRPLVTIQPDLTRPICAECNRRLGLLGGPAVAVGRSEETPRARGGA